MRLPQTATDSVEHSKLYPGIGWDGIHLSLTPPTTRAPLAVLTTKSIPQTTACHWQAIAHQSSQSKWSLWWTCWSGCCTFTLTLSHLWSILSIRLLHFLNQNNHYDQQCRSGFCTFTLLTNSVDQAAALSLSQSKRSLWSIVLIRPENIVWRYIVMLISCDFQNIVEISLSHFFWPYHTIFNHEILLLF